MTDPVLALGLGAFALLLVALPLAFWSVSGGGQGSTAVRLLVAGANFSLTAQLVLRWWQSGHFPISNLYESLCFLAWACTLTGLADSADKLARKDQELALADAVIVPSAYVRSTLELHQACTTPIHVVPFGSPAPLAGPPAASPNGEPLRVLYVGSLGQRKGLSYLLEAIEALGDTVRLTLIGRPTAGHCGPLDAALQLHHWVETLPHPQILEQMRLHDVLVFPTLFDGFGLVITEALSQGLPVITTVHSGAPECIRDGVEGFIVPIRDSQAIAERLQQLAGDRDRLAAMRQACLRRAAELSWARYEQGLRQVVGQVLSQPPPLA